MDNISYSSGNCGIEDEMMVRRYVDILTGSPLSTKASGLTCAVPVRTILLSS